MEKAVREQFTKLSKGVVLVMKHSFYLECVDEPEDALIAWRHEDEVLISVREADEENISVLNLEGVQQLLKFLTEQASILEGDE